MDSIFGGSIPDPETGAEETIDEAVDESAEDTPELEDVDEVGDLDGAPSDNESSDPNPELLTPVKKLIADKYTSAPEAYKGIAHLAALKMSKGELDAMPMLRPNMTAEELEAIYLDLSKPGKRGQTQTQTQPPAGEPGGTPPEDEVTLEVFQQQLRWLQDQSRQAGVPFKLDLGEQAPEQAQPVQQVQAQQPGQPQQTQPQQAQPTQSQIMVDEPPVDFAPIVTKHRESLAPFLGVDSPDDVPDVVAPLVAFVGDLIHLFAEREEKIFAKNVEPWFREVNGSVTKHQSDLASVNETVATVRSERDFDRLSRAYFTAHPDQKDLEGYMKEFWVATPYLHTIKGGADPVTRTRMPSGIEVCATLAANFARLNSTNKPDTQKPNNKDGLRVKGGGASTARTNQKPDPAAVTIGQIFGQKKSGSIF